MGQIEDALEKQRAIVEHDAFRAWIAEAVRVLREARGNMSQHKNIVKQPKD